MKLRPLALVAIIAFSLPATTRAQDERAVVIATVQKVFDAMRTRDTALLHQAFDSSARLVGVSRRGTPEITRMSPAQFGGAFTRAKAGDVWNERMFDPEVNVDGDLATVWTYYTFHLNDTFSHCGTDAVMLRKVGGVWKITQLADTQRSQGCTHTESPAHKHQRH